MKTLKICSAILLCLIYNMSFSQNEPLLASIAANDKKPVVDGTIPESIEKKEEEKTFTLSGTIDTYFHSTFGTTNPFMGGAYGPSTSFADLKGFGLGMANVILNYSGDKAGFTADLVFGPRGKAAVFATSSGQAIVNQMFAYYKLNEKVTLNLGQFNTFLGYEVISPAVNFHYSTSYLFSWGPFNHTGFRADVDLGDGLVAKLAVMNPTDIVEFNPVNTYTLGGQIGKTTDAGGVWVNFLYGDQDGTLKDTDPAFDDDGNLIYSAGKLFQADLTSGWNLSEKFYLGLNTSYQTVASGQQFISEGDVEDAGGGASTFFGLALYPKVTLSESFALGLRAEYLGVTNGHLGIFGVDSSGKGSVVEFTLSGNYKVHGLTFIPEFRIDQASEESFIDDDGTASRVMSSISLAAVYKF